MSELGIVLHARVLEMGLADGLENIRKCEEDGEGVGFHEDLGVYLTV